MPLPQSDTGALLTLDLPDHGRISIPLAGVGGRAAAALVDVALMVLVGGLLVFSVVWAVPGVGGLGDLAMPVLVAVLSFLPFFGPLYFELTWRGQTPGKRMLHLRVISTDGSAPGAGQLLLRNILRLVDFLPFGYLLGLITLFASAQSQRLGDLVGGTLVVREDADALREVSGYARLDGGVLPTELYGIPEPILRGAELLLDPTRALDPVIRQSRTAHVAALIRQHRPDLAAQSDEALLRRVVESLKEAAAPRPSSR